MKEKLVFYRPAVAAFLTWLVIFKISGYVSLGSILGAISLPVWCLGATVGWIVIPLMNANLSVVMREGIPVEMQGRVWAARNTLQFFTIPVGYLLGGTLVDEAAELARAQEGTARIASTKAPVTPTPEPQGQDAMLLYYNSDGGKYYHIKASCSAVSEQYWPLTPFYYGDLETQRFANLMRCPTCDAPARK